MNLIRKLNNYFKSSWLPFRKTSASKFLSDKRVLFGLKISEPMENSRSTAADDGTVVLYIINALTQAFRLTGGNMWMLIDANSSNGLIQDSTSLLCSSRLVELCWMEIFPQYSKTLFFWLDYRPMVCRYAILAICSQI